MTTPPFYPPAGNGQPQQQAPQQAPRVVRGGDGRTYMETPQGMVPVNITPATNAGDPSQAQVPNQAPAPQMQQQPPQQQAPTVPSTQGMTADTILRGPAFKPWMQGRTLGQVMQMVDTMQENYIRSQQGQQPQAQPQAQQAQVNAPQNGQQPVMDARTFFTDPVTNTRKVVEQAIKETLAPMLQPIQQQSAQGAIERTRDEFLRMNPEASEYMPAMMPLLQQSSAEQLTNLQTWSAIYRYAVGQAVLDRQAQMASGGYQPNPQQQPQNGWNQPDRVTPQGMFFSERSSPSPQALGVQQGVNAAQLSQSELATARASGMTPEQYAQAKNDLMNNRMPQFGMPVGQQPGGGRQW